MTGRIVHSSRKKKETQLSLAPGARLGSLEVQEPLGKGGMGEVWRATDTRLGRDVAVKVLPAAFAADPERLARFEREAKLLASLNHPGIAHALRLREATLTTGPGPLPGDGAGRGRGPRRAPRARRRPVDEALAVARQIAEALEAAHERGIVHRDLKPANVKLTPRRQGQGARLRPGQGMVGGRGTPASSADLSQSPTLARTGTAAGLILGTAAYMAPEQARGKPVDKRADIWAFGVVLFEMLTRAQAVRRRDGHRRARRGA